MQYMRAVILGADGPTVENVERPSPGPAQVLVRVHAACLNRADLLIAAGAFHGGTGGPGARLGLEWSGEIAEVGPGVDQWRPGDRVMGSGPGAFAEYTLGYAAFISAVPDALRFEQAACLPVALQTTHDALATNGQLRPGQSVLVQGASSGVGIMALQVARLLGATRIVGTSTKPDRRARLAEFGATFAVDTGAADWVEEVLDVTDGAGVDLVIDMLAGPLIDDTMRATRLGGRIVNVGRMAGEHGRFDFDLHSTRRIAYVGVTFRTRTPPEIKAVIDASREALGPALAAGELSLPIDSTFALDDVAVAFERMAGNLHFGKIVLSVT